MVRTIRRLLDWKQLAYERRWLEAKRERERTAEKQQDYLKPLQVINTGTVAVHCHLVRNLSGRVERYFQFGRYYVYGRTSFAFSSILNACDLDDLEKAISEARRWMRDSYRT